MKQRGWICVAMALAITATAVHAQPDDDDTPYAITMVYIVRHAEKTPGEHPQHDNPLTAKGHARARTLSELLQDIDLDAIYTTKWRRCRDTIAPIAAHQNIEPTVYRAMNAAEDIVPQVLSRAQGSSVLIVGHSNTVTGIARAFGANANFELTEEDYDDLFVITLIHQPDGSHTSFMQRLHFEPWE